MKVLITGGAGFIGKYLTKYLVEKDFSVTILDNFSNSTRDSVSSLIDMGVKVIEGDITKRIDILNAGENQDVIIHLAAKISVPESIKNPTETFLVNVNGTRNVLESCEKNQIKKIIVVSSAAVYGEGKKNIKLTERTNTNPISPYGESKVRMEQEIKDFKSNHEINCIILRFFNIYGIGQSKEYAGVVTKFIEKIKQGNPLEIFGDGLQTRDFVSVYDVINSIHNTIIKGKNGIYNIASGKIITVKDLAKLMILFSGKKLEIKYLNVKKGDIKYSQADISQAEKDLGYSPKFGLDKIKEIIE